jgi:hypothetical protein
VECLINFLGDEYGASQVGPVLHKKSDGNGMEVSPSSVARGVERLISTIDGSHNVTAYARQRLGSILLKDFQPGSSEI